MTDTELREWFFNKQRKMRDQISETKWNPETFRSDYVMCLTKRRILIEQSDFIYSIFKRLYDRQFGFVSGYDFLSKSPLQEKDLLMPNQEDRIYFKVKYNQNSMFKKRINCLEQVTMVPIKYTTNIKGYNSNSPWTPTSLPVLKRTICYGYDSQLGWWCHKDLENEVNKTGKFKFEKRFDNEIK